MEYGRRQTVVRLSAPREKFVGTVLPEHHRSERIIGDPVTLKKLHVPQTGAQIRRALIEAQKEKFILETTSDFSSTLETGWYGRVLAFILIPLIFIQPLLPLYAHAADDAVAPPPSTPAPEVVTTEAPASSADVTPNGETPLEVSADVVPSVTPTDEASISVTPQEGVVETAQSENPNHTPPPPSPTEEASPGEGVSEQAPDGAGEIDATTTPEASGTTADIIDADLPIQDIPTGEIGTTTDDNGVAATIATGTQVDLIEDDIVASSSDDVLIEEATTTVEVLEEAVPEEVAQPTGPTPEELAEAERLRAEAARNQLKKEVAEEFLRGCISFEHTGYYCLPPDAPVGANEGAARTIPVIMSEPGENGYKQIFLTQGAVRTQLTNDAWDNAFPTQDISGEHFVWQGMKSGRWQIFFADMTGTGTPRVSQVTDSTESNFNPKVDAEHIVWQGWADNNWEVFLATRRPESPFVSEHLPPANVLLGVGSDWDVLRLTTNTEHDMFPSLHGDIVTWQSHERDTWVVYAYSISSGTKTQLSSDGTKSENPRFAITWEEHDDNGRSRLMSYDMATGKKSDLTQEARRATDNPFPTQPPSPLSQPDQAALPVTTTVGTSTPVRGDDDAGGNNAPTP